MTPADLNGQWRYILPAAFVLAGGGGFTGGALSQGVTEAKVEKIVENHPEVVLLKERLIVLQDDVTEIKDDNETAHGAIMDELKALRKDIRNNTP